jgi:hypothetical protein
VYWFLGSLGIVRGLERESQGLRVFGVFVCKRVGVTFWFLARQRSRGDHRLLDDSSNFSSLKGF